ncbi:hypothetical protein HPB51_014520 [Rhipicephalus microplus]|uniref:Transposable element P transposase-like RNase H domain-containing protein n=1 Tax=Rhipicephalus microplus TaxID=6941 RepID=A0A9J6EGV5_RHIMP|nr:hypothetical protein HPB51_014520 [Rhipicephalus microplus]
MRVLANKNARLMQNLDKLSTREKLIFDKSIMKANAKSPKAARSLKADFGFKSTLFTVLRDKKQVLPERKHQVCCMSKPVYFFTCVPMFDVRKSLHIRKSDMALLGKANFADHTRPPDCEKDGDHALVFLFRPFLGGWSQTVGTFCSSGAAPGSIVAKLLLQCIVHLSNAGTIVDAVTCDNSTPSRSALRSLGINSDQKQLQTSFQHPYYYPSRTVQALINPPPVFNCIRNNLQKVGKFLLPQGDEVHHYHYSALLEYEEQQAGLRAVPKLIRAHIFPNVFQKMSVQLAVQASNHS